MTDIQSDNDFGKGFAQPKMTDLRKRAEKTLKKMGYAFLLADPECVDAMISFREEGVKAERERCVKACDEFLVLDDIKEAIEKETT